jgi:hypothetical protein
MTLAPAMARAEMAAAMAVVPATAILATESPEMATATALAAGRVPAVAALALVEERRPSRSVTAPVLPEVRT